MSRFPSLKGRRGKGPRPTVIDAGKSKLSDARAPLVIRVTDEQAARISEFCRPETVMDPNMTVMVDIGPDGTGSLVLAGIQPQAVSDLSVSEGEVALTSTEGETSVVVSGAKPDTQVQVSYYTPPE
jgi:hypothetical protein